MRFKSINYARVECIDCNQITEIHPGKQFGELNCLCNKEISKQFTEIKEYSSGSDVFELLGEYQNGDLEIKRINGSLCYRIEADVFAKDFTLIDKTQQPRLEISKEYLINMTHEQIKQAYPLEQLRELGKSLKIAGAMQMKEGKLIERIMNS